MTDPKNLVAVVQQLANDIRSQDTTVENIQGPVDPQQEIANILVKLQESYNADRKKTDELHATWIAQSSALTFPGSEEPLTTKQIIDLRNALMLGGKHIWTAEEIELLRQWLFSVRRAVMPGVKSELTFSQLNTILQTILEWKELASNISLPRLGDKKALSSTEDNGKLEISQIYSQQTEPQPSAVATLALSTTIQQETAPVAGPDTILRSTCDAEKRDIITKTEEVMEDLKAMRDLYLSEFQRLKALPAYEDLESDEEDEFDDKSFKCPSVRKTFKLVNQMMNLQTRLHDQEINTMYAKLPGPKALGIQEHTDKEFFAAIQQAVQDRSKIAALFPDDQENDNADLVGRIEKSISSKEKEIVKWAQIAKMRKDKNQELEAKVQEYEEVQKKFNQSSEENRKITMELQERNKAIETLKSQVSTLEADLAACRGGVTKLNTKNEESARHTDADLILLREQVAGLNEQLKDAKEAQGVSKRTQESLKTQVAELTTQNKDLTKEKESNKTLTLQVKTLASERDRLQGQYDTESGAHKRLQAQYKTVVSEKAQLEEKAKQSENVTTSGEGTQISADKEKEKESLDAEIKEPEMPIHSPEVQNKSLGKDNSDAVPASEGENPRKDESDDLPEAAKEKLSKEESAGSIEADNDKIGKESSDVPQANNDKPRKGKTDDLQAMLANAHKAESNTLGMMRKKIDWAEEMEQEMEREQGSGATSLPQQKSSHTVSPSTAPRTTSAPKSVGLGKSRHAPSSTSPPAVTSSPAGTSAAKTSTPAPQVGGVAVSKDAPGGGSSEAATSSEPETSSTATKTVQPKGPTETGGQTSGETGTVIGGQSGGQSGGKTTASAPYWADLNKSKYAPGNVSSTAATPLQPGSSSPESVTTTVPGTGGQTGGQPEGETRGQGHSEGVPGAVSSPSGTSSTAPKTTASPQTAAPSTAPISSQPASTPPAPTPTAGAKKVGLGSSRYAPTIPSGVGGAKGGETGQGAHNGFPTATLNPTAGFSFGAPGPEVFNGFTSGGTGRGVKGGETRQGGENRSPIATPPTAGAKTGGFSPSGVNEQGEGNGGEAEQGGKKPARRTGGGKGGTRRPRTNIFGKKGKRGGGRKGGA